MLTGDWTNGDPFRKVYAYKLNDDGTLGERIEVELTTDDNAKRRSVLNDLMEMLGKNGIALTDDEVKG